MCSMQQSRKEEATPDNATSEVDVDQKQSHAQSNAAPVPSGVASSGAKKKKKRKKFN